MWIFLKVEKDFESFKWTLCLFFIYDKKKQPFLMVSVSRVPVVFSFMHEPEFASNSNHFYEQLID